MRSEGTFTIEASIRRAQYALLQAAKNSGGKCETCANSKLADGVTHCTIKRNKVVNKFSICELFK